MYSGGQSSSDKRRPLYPTLNNYAPRVPNSTIYGNRHIIALTFLFV